jgi:hypothetical protein
MVEIHCHVCGGFIGDTATIAYRRPLDTVHTAVPRTALCECLPPIVYGPPPGHLSSPGIPAIARPS